MGTRSPHALREETPRHGQVELDRRAVHRSRSCSLICVAGGVLVPRTASQHSSSLHVIRRGRRYSRLRSAIRRRAAISKSFGTPGYGLGVDRAAGNADCGAGGGRKAAHLPRRKHCPRQHGPSTDGQANVGSRHARTSAEISGQRLRRARLLPRSGKRVGSRCASISGCRTRRPARLQRRSRKKEARAIWMISPLELARISGRRLGVGDNHAR